MSFRNKGPLAGVHAVEPCRRAHLPAAHEDGVAQRRLRRHRRRRERQQADQPGDDRAEGEIAISFQVLSVSF